MASTHPAERRRTLGVGASSQSPALSGQLIPPLGVRGCSSRAIGGLTSRLLEKQCRRVQDGMREEALESIAPAGAHPQAATAYLDVDRCGPSRHRASRSAMMRAPRAAHSDLVAQ